MGKLDTVKNFVKTKASKAAFFVEKHSPEICVGSGLVMITVGVVAACKATLKVDDILEEHHKTVQTIGEVASEAEEQGVDYSEKDQLSDISTTTIKTSAKLVKNYAGAAGLILGGMGLVVLGFKKEHERLVVMTNTANSILAYAMSLENKSNEDHVDKIMFDKHEETYKVYDEATGEVIDEKVISDMVDKELLYSGDSIFTKVISSKNPNWVHGDEDCSYMIDMIATQFRTLQTLLDNSKTYIKYDKVCELIGFDDDGEDQISWIAGWLRGDLIDCFTTPVHYVDNDGKLVDAIVCRLNPRPSILGEVNLPFAKEFGIN